MSIEVIIKKASMNCRAQTFRDFVFKSYYTSTRCILPHTLTLLHHTQVTTSTSWYLYSRTSSQVTTPTSWYTTSYSYTPSYTSWNTTSYSYTPFTSTFSNWYTTSLTYLAYCFTIQNLRSTPLRTPEYLSLTEKHLHSHWQQSHQKQNISGANCTTLFLTFQSINS